MWCYQKPGFGALLLTELQRQQQCSEFCDTLLKAGGVSVPAHSCILSAISPHFSSTLSSSPVPPAGQSRLLEFQALGACTLLHIIRLLYSGEMAGEGETEKEQAVYAAAKLGISGLVEVKKSQTKEGGERGVTGGQYAEVGVQTEGNEWGLSKWRREVRDGNTYLWKETPSDVGKDIWTQTEEMQENMLPPALPPASFETIDMNAFQTLGQADPHQFVPITIVYPPEENQTVLVSSDAPTCVHQTAACTSVAPPYLSVPPPLPYFPRETAPQNGWLNPQGAGGNEEWEDNRIEQFDGNIAGFIDDFLNPSKAKGTRGRRRAGRRPRGARGVGRPRGRSAGRGRRAFTQRVDTQEVGVGEKQKQFLNRWGTRTPRTGQGGGVVGRKLVLKEREVPPAARRAPSRRGRGKATEVFQSRDTVPRGNTEHGQENTPTQLHQGSLSGSRDRRSTTKSTPVPAPSKEIYSRPPPYASSSSLSDTLRSPATSCVLAASSVLRSTRLPPPPPHENQPEQIDRLLEEVIMGLDILPKDNSDGASHSESELPENSGPSANSQNKGQAPMTDAEVPVLQQQCEGELSEILKNLLHSFEQHVDSCNAREDETGDGSSSEVNQPYTSLDKSKRAETQTETPHTLQLQNQNTPRPTQRPETSELLSQGSELMEHARKTETNTTGRRMKRTRNYLFSLEKKRMKSVSSGDRKAKDQQIPEEPETSNLLPGQRCLQEKKTKTCASTVKSSRNGASVKNHQLNWIRESYPIRSRFREEQIMDVTAFLEDPLPAKQSRGCRRSRPRTSRQRESAAAPLQPQPADSCCTDDPSETNQGRTEEDQAGGPTGNGQKRSNEDTSEEATANKRICLDQSETLVSSSEPADLVSSTEQEEAIDEEMFSLIAGLGCCFEGAKQENKKVMEEGLTGEAVQSDADEEIHMEVDQEDAETLKTENNRLPCLNKTTSQERTRNCDQDLDEDVDVIGGSGPAPDPVIISWTESVDDGEEDAGEVDVVGETVDDISSFFLAALRKHELGYEKHQTEAHSH